MKAKEADLSCTKAMDMFGPYHDRELPTGEVGALEAHIDGCDRCRGMFEEHNHLASLLDRTYDNKRISDGFDAAANRKLLQMRDTADQDAVAPGRSYTDDEYDEDESVAAPAESFLDTLARHFGPAPWWLISGAFHALLLLLITLIGMAILQQKNNDVVIVTDLAEKKEPEKLEKPVERDIIPKPVPIENQEITDQMPIVTHEEVEISEEVETDNDSDAHDTRGEDGISDVWLGGSGTVAALGLGGGGGGAFGRPGGAGGRLRRAIRGGGSRATESAVDAALAWLARNQEPEGRWDAIKHGGWKRKDDVAVSALALLAFLGAGHTEKIGKYRDNVKRSVAWLISQQDAEGHLKGGGYGYNHSIAGLSLAEAAAMGRVGATVAAAQKAVDFSCEKFQAGKGSERMGWRYSPKSVGDTSVSGWFIMQLKSAKVAGLKVDPASFEGAANFLDTVELAEKDADNPYSGHRYGYMVRGGAGGPNKKGQNVNVKNPHGNTSIGCLGRLFLGVPPEEVRGGVEYFIREGGVPRADHPEFYHWYYATLCSFQMGGEIWKRWNKGLKESLLSMQRKGGDEDGSWDPKGHSTEGAERVGGRVFTTAIGAMCLEVYYRYLPMYRE